MPLNCFAISPFFDRVIAGVLSKRMRCLIFIASCCFFLLAVAGSCAEQSVKETENGRTCLGRLSEHSVEGWEAGRLDAASNQWTPIEDTEFFVIADGSKTARGDKAAFRFDFEGSVCTCEGPATENAS